LLRAVWLETQVGSKSAVTAAAGLRASCIHIAVCAGAAGATGAAAVWRGIERPGLAVKSWLVVIAQVFHCRRYRAGWFAVLPSLRRETLDVVGAKRRVGSSSPGRLIPDRLGIVGQ